MDVKQEIRNNWTVSDNKRSVTHNNGRIKISLKDRHPYSSYNPPKRYLVMIDGNWLTDYGNGRGPITEYKSLESAINKAYKLINGGDNA